jgi:multidrug efflux pump subunit AcrA (membrane-fusion protein)
MDGNQAYVMRQTTGGQFERVAVTLGKSLGGNVEIVDGLAEGDIIGVVTQVTATATPEESSGFRMPGLGGLLGGGGGRP